MDFMQYFYFVLSEKQVLKHRVLMDFGQKNTERISAR